MRSAGALCVTLGLWAACGSRAPASADHIGVLQLNGDAAGPYVVSAWTQPSPVRVGSGAVTIAVMRPASRVALTDVSVRVTATRPEDAGDRVAIEASRGRDPLGIRYLADLDLPAAGRWRITVAVRGPDGAGSVDFPLEVKGGSRSGWLPFMLGAAGVVGLLVWRLGREWRWGRVVSRE
jgi:hypothetical protein